MVWKLVAVGEGGEPPFSVTQALLLQDLTSQMKGCQNRPLQDQQLSLLAASARHSHEWQFETARTVPCSTPSTSLQSLSPGSPRLGRTQESRSRQPELGSPGPCCSHGIREEPRLGSTCVPCGRATCAPAAGCSLQATQAGPSTAVPARMEPGRVAIPTQV